MINKNQKIKCLECGKSFKIITHTHLMRFHRMIVNEYRQLHPGALMRVGNDVYFKSMTCKICGDETQYLRHHVVYHHKVDYRDYVDAFVSKDEIPTDELIECLICHKKFRFINTMHLKSAHQMSQLEYLTKFPDAKLLPEKTQKTRNKGIGKAREVWCSEHPEEVASQMGKISQDNWDDPKKRRDIIDAQSEGKRNSELYASSHSRPHTKEENLKVSIGLSKAIREGRVIPPNRRSKPGMYKGIMFRSQMEIEYARFLDGAGIRWEYENYTLAWIDSDGIVRNYTPDFFIPDASDDDLRVFTEVKGCATQSDFDKIRRTMENNPDVSILMYADRILQSD